MRKTLFEEAVFDTEQLKIAAEETAKNRVIEAVMPQIRDLINKRIMKEADETDDLEDEDSEDDIDDMGSDLGSFDDSPLSNPTMVDMSPLGTSVPLEDDKEGSSPVSINVDGDVNIVLDNNKKNSLSDSLFGEGSGNKTTLDERIDNLFENTNDLLVLKEALTNKKLSKKQNEKINKLYASFVKEALELKTEQKLQTSQGKLEDKLAETIKELKNMSTANRRNVFDFLFEYSDEPEDKKDEACKESDEKSSDKNLEEAELTLSLSDDEQQDLVGAEDTEDLARNLEDLLSGLSIDLNLGGDAEEGSDEGDDEELEVDDELLDAPEGDVEEGEPEMDEEPVEEADDSEMLEIDETMLKNELLKMLSEKTATNQSKEKLYEVSKEDLITVLQEELSKRKRTFAQPRRSRNDRSTFEKQLNEAKKQLTNYKKANSELKAQLVEMNIFNAKLLYANKLMQNKDLTMKQQKAIVEALDNAKTLREAKLLYQSLSESLGRRARRLAEGANRTSGSSSRATPSATPKNNGVEVDRWAVLAGLGED